MSLSAPKQTPLFVKILNGKRSILVKDLIPTFNFKTNHWHPPTISPKRQSALRKLATIYHVSIPGIYQAPSYHYLLQNTPENLLKRLNHRTSFNFFKSILPHLQNNQETTTTTTTTTATTHLLQLANAILATEPPIQSELKYLESDKKLFSPSSSLRNKISKSKTTHLSKEHCPPSLEKEKGVVHLPTQQAQPTSILSELKDQKDCEVGEISLDKSPHFPHYTSLYHRIDGLSEMSKDEARKLAVLERMQLRYPLRLPGRRKLSKAVKNRVKRQVLVKENLAKMPALIAAYREDRRKQREAAKPKYPY